MLSVRAKSGDFSINVRARNWAERKMHPAQFLARTFIENSLLFASLRKHTKPPATQAIVNAEIRAHSAPLFHKRKTPRLHETEAKDVLSQLEKWK